MTPPAAPPFAELNPSPRLLMGPGPVNADPRVLQAMAMPLLGQFDPEFRQFMAQTMALYRGVFCTQNQWTFCIDGTARAGIEAALVSLIEPGDRVLVPIFGRFGHLLVEIARRAGAAVKAIETEWGGVFDQAQLEAEIAAFAPKLVAICQGDTSTTMAQPLDRLGSACRRHGALLYVDATASIVGMPLLADAWQLDVVSCGLQKCLSGPSGMAPITLSDAAAAAIGRRRHIEQGLQPPGYAPGNGRPIASNYFDLAMIMDYWSDKALNHHTEATTMLYAARECARIVWLEGLEAVQARHALASRAMLAGITALGLKPYGDLAHKMPNVTGVHIPAGIDGEKIRGRLLAEHRIEIGTSFGPLHGKIWRIGAMGYNARAEAVLKTLAALEAALAAEGFKAPAKSGARAAAAVYDAA